MGLGGTDAGSIALASRSLAVFPASLPSRSWKDRAKCPQRPSLRKFGGWTRTRNRAQQLVHCFNLCVPVYLWDAEVMPHTRTHTGALTWKHRFITPYTSMFPACGVSA